MGSALFPQYLQDEIICACGSKSCSSVRQLTLCLDGRINIPWDLSLGLGEEIVDLKWHYTDKDSYQSLGTIVANNHFIHALRGRSSLAHNTRPSLLNVSVNNSGEFSTPSMTYRTSTHHDRHDFYLVLSNPVEGGNYSCYLPRSQPAVACLGNDSALLEDAILLVDDVHVRIALLEAEQHYLQSENNHLKELNNLLLITTSGNNISEVANYTLSIVVRLRALEEENARLNAELNSISNNDSLEAQNIIFIEQRLYWLEQENERLRQELETEESSNEGLSSEIHSLEAQLANLSKTVEWLKSQLTESSSSASHTRDEWQGGSTSSHSWSWASTPLYALATTPTTARNRTTSNWYWWQQSTEETPTSTENYWWWTTRDWRWWQTTDESSQTFSTTTPDYWWWQTSSSWWDWDSTYYQWWGK